MPRVAIVDDSLEVQRSLGRLLYAVSGIEMVGYAEDVQGGLRMFEQSRPDALVLDFRLRNGESGMTVLREVHKRFSAVQVIMLSNALDDLARTKLLNAGAKACFDKSTEFLKARDWMSGEGYER